jgi:hypothetical protein
LDSALADKEALSGRIERYRDTFVKNHHIDTVVPRVASRIRAGTVDWSAVQKHL